MLTVSIILAITAFICTIANALDRCPLWIAVLLLTVLALLQNAPLGK